MQHFDTPGLLDYDATKPDTYFSGARVDWIDRLPKGAGLTALEIGCGHGATGAYALSTGACASYTGVEIAEQAAARARDVLTEVVVGNVEEVVLPFAPESFDVLILSEVLEHLVDPWVVVQRLAPLMRPGARVFASSPNVAHKDIVKQLLRGRWDLADMGAMDRTHLRWFTPATYTEMFETAGFTIEQVGPLNPHRRFRQRLFSALTGRRYDHLFAYQINLIGRKT